MPFRAVMGSIPGIVEPVKRKGSPLTVTSGIVGQKAKVGIASSELNVFGTMPGTTVPSVSTTQMLPRTESVRSSRPSSRRTKSSGESDELIREAHETGQIGREAGHGVGRVRVLVDDRFGRHEGFQLRQPARRKDADAPLSEFVHDEGHDEPAGRLRKLADLLAGESRVREHATVQRIADEVDLPSRGDSRRQKRNVGELEANRARRGDDVEVGLRRPRLFAGSRSGGRSVRACKEYRRQKGGSDPFQGACRHGRDPPL